jgi:hypothetical protein
MTAAGGPISIPCRASWRMAKAGRPRSPPCELLRSGLQPIVSITARKFLPHLQKSSPWHEPLAVRKSQAIAGGLSPNRMDGNLAERLPSEAEAGRMGQLHVRVSRWSHPFDTRRVRGMAAAKTSMQNSGRAVNVNQYWMGGDAVERQRLYSKRQD